MTPTKEQYELAAKAAGGTLYYDTRFDVRFIPQGTAPEFNVLSLPQWRPHEDRADAFSLLCAIKGDLSIRENAVYCLSIRENAVYFSTNTLQTDTVSAEHLAKEEIEAAACEVIFLCAVEVGRGLA